MTVQQNNMMLLDASGLPRTVDTANDSIRLDVPVSIQAVLDVGADVNIDGDLTVKGDIVSRSQTDVLIQDSYLDLNFGDDSSVVSGGGFTVSMAKASGFSTETVTDFVAGVAATSAPTFTVSGSSNLAAGDVVAIAGAVDSENDGLFIVASVAGGVVTIKGVGGTSPSANLPFVQNQFKAATSQSAKAYKVDLAAVAIADGSGMLDSSAAAWPVGSLVSGYMAAATESGWYWDAPTNVSLQEAYVTGNQITTSAGEGNLQISGTEKLLVDSSGGVEISGVPLAVSGTTTLTGAATLTGGLTVNTLPADFNAGVTANEIKIDGDVATRLYLVGSTGEIKDEAKLRYDGTNFMVGVSGSEVFQVAAATGNTSISGTLAVTGAATLSDTLAVTGAATLSSTLDVAGDLDVGAGKLTVAAASGDTAIAGTLDVTGAADLASTLNVTGQSTLASAAVSDLTSGRVVLAGTGGELEDSGNLTFDGSTLAVTGAATISSTLGVTGAATLSSTLDVTGATGIDGNFDIATDKFTVAAATGNTAIAGDLSLEGSLAINTDKFTVAAASGDTAIAGTLAVTGESTLASATVSDLTDNRIVLAGVAGALEDDANFRFDGTDFMIGAAGSEVFEVAVASGNTSIAGTLGVTGAATLSSTLAVVGDADLQAALDVAGLSAFASTGGSSAAPDFQVAGYAQFAGVVDLNGSIDADVSGMDVASSGQVQLASSQAALNAIRLNASAGGIDIDAADDIAIDSAKGLSLQAAGSSDLSMVADDANDQTLTIDAQNSGVGMGILVLDADDSIQIGDAAQAGLQIELNAFAAFNVGAGISVKAGESIAAGDAVYVKYDIDGPRYFKAANNSVSDDERIVMGIAAAPASGGDMFPLQCVVGIQAMSAMLSLATDKIGKPVYLGTGGALTLTAPTASGSTVFRVGYVSGNDAGGAAIHFMPQFIAKRP